MNNTSVATVMNHSKKRAKPKKTLANVLTYIVLIAYAVIQMFPFAIIIITALSKNEFVMSEMKFQIPTFKDVTMQNFIDVFTDTRMLIRFSDGTRVNGLIRGFVNTMWQVLPTTLIGLFISGLAAYAYAKMEFIGKKTMYAIQIAIIALPMGTLGVPTYLFYNSLGLVGTIVPIMVPGMFGGAVTVFYLTQYFRSIPTSVVEAAKIDGLNYFSIYLIIMIPLAVPAFMAQGILSFVGGYNGYMGALLYLSDKPELFPLQLALRRANSRYSALQPGNVCANTMISMLPLIIIYIIGRKQFKTGITGGAVKG